MLSQCLVPSIIKKVISYKSVLGQQPLITLQIQNFQYILKSLETFLIRNYYYSNVKKYKWDQKSGIKPNNRVLNQKMLDYFNKV